MKINYLSIWIFLICRVRAWTTVFDGTDKVP
jgi:hypothetical protein